MAFFLCFFVLFLASSASACDRCAHQSKASHFPKDAPPLSPGACGYDSLALDISFRKLAAGAALLFNNGAGCGACFQVRCKNPDLCTKAGTRVTLTDLNPSNETDFVLSSRALTAMALKEKRKEILKHDILDIEYKRVPCEFADQKLAVRVEESSKKPDSLVIKILYQGGQTEIVGVNVAQIGSSEWEYMTRHHGAVWETSKVPKGALQLMFVVTAGSDQKQIVATKVLPANWKKGKIYDSDIQITEIAQEECPICADEKWE
ncbi:unnamed protein product [Lathyrus sativus]|nr:unnamed protein product [Lathyrus sativus]CAK8087131.1 unnamed protein product [Lathyrus sativus]CAK8087132.1 unnamed protein product [Lathyrus sativus]CAK8087136.1 unnamed protein product [Lathyrus sativus]